MNEVQNETNAEVKVEKKPYTFRKLCATDLAPMCKVVSKIGINEFAGCFQSDGIQNLVKNLKDSKSKNDLDDIVGIQVILEIANVVMSHFPSAEKDIFELLASVSGLKVADIKAFSLATVADMVIDFVSKEEFKDFFKVVSKLFV